MKKIIGTIGALAIGYSIMKLTAYYELKGIKKTYKFIKANGWKIVNEEGSEIAFIDN